MKLLMFLLITIDTCTSYTFTFGVDWFEIWVLLNNKKHCFWWSRIGACMITGNIEYGFKSTLDTYILNALASVDHAYVYLFTLFLSGLVAVMEKSGGLLGFTKELVPYATGPHSGQFVAFCSWLFIFFMTTPADCLLVNPCNLSLTFSMSLGRSLPLSSMPRPLLLHLWLQSILGGLVWGWYHPRAARSHS